MAKQKIGLHMSLSYSAFNEGPRLGREAEECGYTSLWTGEVAGPDPFLNLGAIASNTSRIELATGVVPIQTRTPNVLAMGFLTLNEISRGRVIAGLGVSSPIIVERWHGASYRKPVTTMRECVTILRSFFKEGRCKFEGEILKSDLTLALPRTQRPPKIYLAALNPPMLRLAGEVADGVLLTFSPPEAIPPMLAEIRAGAEKAGRKLADIDISIYIRACVTDDEAAAAAAFKREFARYAFVDTYNAMFARYGLADEFAEVRRLWREGKRDEAPHALSDATAHRLGAFGPAETGRSFVASFRASGVTHPVVFPISPGSDGVNDFRNTMNALADA